MSSSSSSSSSSSRANPSAYAIAYKTLAPDSAILSDPNRGFRRLKELLAQDEDPNVVRDTISKWYDGPLPSYENCLDKKTGQFDGEKFLDQLDLSRIIIDNVPREDEQFDLAVKGHKE